MMKKKGNRFFSCDVLIIGGGSAGLRAAMAAHDSGADVLIVSKSKKGDPHTVLATGGINAALGTMDPKDNWKIHAADTLREGRFLADYEMVETLCRNAPKVIEELVDWGVRFHREKDGRLTQRFFGAHTYRRTCFYGDETGKEIIRVLMNQIRKRKIKIIDGVYITKFVKSDRRGEMEGAFGIDFKTNNFVTFRSKCAILAGGGYARVYEISSSRLFENYGEGVALAYEAGAKMIDMEMVQFHPTGMVWPKSALGTLATEAIRGEGGILLNAKGERFMANYDPEKMELGPRDEVARANYKEIISGRGTKHGGVWLDITHLPKKKILQRLPKMYRQFKGLAGIDISKKKMEVAPTAHYSMGGIRIDTQGRTSIGGLFAVGEVTGQLHGANRLGGNSLLETVVFGKIVGKQAARFSKQQKKMKPLPKEDDDIDKKLANIGRLFITNNAIKIRNEIQKLMQTNAGIIRDENKLRKGLKRISEIKMEIDEKESDASSLKKISKIDKVNLAATLEAKSALLICEAVIRSALMRKESRGAHYRSDFPKQDDQKWMRNIYCIKRNKDMILFTKKVRKGTIKDLPKNLKPEHHLLE